MAIKSIAKLESRTRVIFNLPANDAAETAAIYEVINYLERLKDRHVGVTGFTLSEVMPAVFAGSWWSEEQGTWMEDAIVMMMVDFAMPPRGAK